MKKIATIQLGRLTVLVAALAQVGLACAGTSGLTLDTNALASTGACSPSTNPATPSTPNNSQCTVNAAPPNNVTISSGIANGVQAPGLLITGDTAVINTVNFSGTASGDAATGTTSSGIRIGTGSAAQLAININDTSTVTGSSGNASDGGTGISGASFTLTNALAGQIIGGAGATGAGASGFSGGAGLDGSKFTADNNGAITGGTGGTGTNGGDGMNASGPATAGNAAAGYAGGIGGAGISSTEFTLNNASNVDGGIGGTGGTGGVGGNASAVPGTGIVGGTAGTSGTGGNGGRGGSGVTGTKFTVNNSGDIVGGKGGTGNVASGGGAANGGSGVNAAGPGNAGGTGGVGGSGGINGSGGVGGAGVSGSDFTLTNASSGKIIGGAAGDTAATTALGAGGSADGGNGSSAGSVAGGTGGNGGTGGAGGQGGSGSTGSSGSTGGVGIAGSNAMIINAGTIAGGVGGRGGNGGTGGTANGGAGGDGSLGPIAGSGGDGGHGGGAGNGGAGGIGGIGGAGITGGAMTLINSGTIIGGAGASGGAGGIGGTANGGAAGTSAPGQPTAAAGMSGGSGKSGADGMSGRGGVGVAATGQVVIINSGSIAGGLSSDGFTRSNAVELSGGNNKLVLQAGAVQTGNVVSSSGTTNGGDTLALGGDINASNGNMFSLTSVGNEAQFRGFQNFSKEGASAWTLSGNGAGNWDIAAGTLVFADGMALTGAVNVTNGATLATNTSSVSGSVSNGGMLLIGAGKTLSITGNFTNTGTLRSTLTDTSVGKIIATGNIALSGNLFVDAAHLTAASTYAGRVNGVLSGNVRTGEFAQVSGNSALFKFTPNYSANGVDLTYATSVTNAFIAPVSATAPGTAPASALGTTPAAPVTSVTPASVTPVAPTPAPAAPANAAAPSGVADAVRAAGGTYGSAIGAAQALDQIINTNPGGAIGSLLLPLTTQQQVANAARQAVPLMNGATILAAQTTLDTINGVIQSRNEFSRGQASSADFLGNKFFWVKPFGSRTNQGTRDNVDGYKTSNTGLVVGIDGADSSTIRVGGALAYAKSDLDSKSSVAPQNAGIKAVQLIGYGSMNLDPATDLDFQVDIGRNQNSGHRPIGFAASTANSSYESRTAHAGLTAGRQFNVLSRTMLTLSLRADYTWIKENAYTETGAGPLNLHVNGRSVKSFVVGADGKVAYQLNDQTRLIGNLGIGYDTINDRKALTSTFAGGPGTSFVTDGITPGPWMTRAGIGIVYLTKTGAEIVGRYDAEHRSSFINQTLSLKARWRF